MDEEISIINTRSRNEKIKLFFTENKKKLIIFFSIIIIIIFCFFIYQDLVKKKKIELSNKFNSVSMNYISGNKTGTKQKLIEVINSNDKTYAPLALYFLIDNDIVNSKEEINNLFDTVINKSKLDKEIKNLIIYKKALFNSEFATESDLLEILNPILNSESAWESHALYLLGEYFYSKGENKKSKEFFEKVINLENSSIELKTESQKRIQRDLSD